MLWARVFLMSAMSVLMASVLAAETEATDKGEASNQNLVTLPPRGAPFDAEKLARIRASLGGASSSDSEATSKTEEDH